jgi:hypothetical protein
LCGQVRAQQLRVRSFAVDTDDQVTIRRGDQASHGNPGWKVSLLLSIGGYWG